MFELRRELGRGAHGLVFEARQLGLDRQVAIKMLLPHALGEEGLVERFKREARLASSLTNPHSVIIHAFGVHNAGHEEPMPYLAMEYLHGEDLANYLVERDTVPVEETVMILRQVLSSLSEAHRKGIVHRDLKPENIFLSQRDTEFVVKVLDFGIAKALEGGASGGGRRLTEDGVVCGTPEYMSPEQAKGMAITPAADIYAVGCIAFQMLTGHPPFHGATAMTVALKHCQSPIPPLPPSVMSSPFGVIVPRAMAKEPGDRYRDASELLMVFEEAFGLAAPASTSGSWARTTPAPSAEPSIPEWALATTPSVRAFRLSRDGGLDVPAGPQGNPPSRDRRFYVAVGEPDDGFPVETTDMPTLMDPEDEWEPDPLGEPEAYEPEDVEAPPLAVSVRTGRPGRAVGQELTPTAPKQPAYVPHLGRGGRGAINPTERQIFIALFIGLAVLLVGVSVTVVIMIATSLPAQKAPVVGASSTVSLTVATSPTGADVFEGPTHIGTTPLTLERPRGGEVRLSLRQRGFKEKVVWFGGTEDGFESVKLERVPGADWVSPVDAGHAHE